MRQPDRRRSESRPVSRQCCLIRRGTQQPVSPAVSPPPSPNETTCEVSVPPLPPPPMTSPRLLPAHPPTVHPPPPLPQAPTSSFPHPEVHTPTTPSEHALPVLSSPPWAVEAARQSHGTPFQRTFIVPRTSAMSNRNHREIRRSGEDSRDDGHQSKKLVSRRSSVCFPTKLSSCCCVWKFVLLLCRSAPRQTSYLW